MNSVGPRRLTESAHCGYAISANAVEPKKSFPRVASLVAGGANFSVFSKRASGPEAVALAAELHATSADFSRLWAENDMRRHWAGLKRIQHPLVGPLTLEYSTFACPTCGHRRIDAMPTDACIYFHQCT